jgi:hypothetical protein
VILTTLKRDRRKERKLGSWKVAVCELSGLIHLQLRFAVKFLYGNEA